jgi:hypothetical protein
MGNYETDFVFYTDQIEIALELHSTRTLSHQGEKSRCESIHSLNAITHSYTVQRTFSAAGHLTAPVYLCLKKPSGKLSESEITFSPNFCYKLLEKFSYLAENVQDLKRSCDLEFFWKTEQICRHVLGK